MKLSTKLFTALFLFTFALSIQAKEINFARYRVVYQSSSADESHCGHLVVDGSLKTYWESLPGKSSFITINLATPEKIEKIVIHWGENFGTKYKVLVSENNLDSFREIYSASNGDGGDDTISYLNGKALLVKIEVSEVKNPVRGCAISEVEVTGTGESDPRYTSAKHRLLSKDHLSLNGNIWKVQNALFLSENPSVISGVGYNDIEWVPASVPGTILGSYYNFGALPDPLYGDNMHQISDEFFSGYDFWYRTTITFDSQMSGKRLFLDFSGINWKAEIYFNSQYLGRIDGAYLRGEFEVTNLINFKGENTIAVLIHHPESWVPGPRKVIKKSIGAKTTNGDLLGLDSPAILASAGWNWLPIIKGRNTGIWNDVRFRIAGNVSINDPWVSSVVPLPDTTKAELTLHTELKNNSSEAKEGQLVAKFGNTVIEYHIKLNGGEQKTISLDKSLYPQLTLKKPELWWPNGYGKPNLHKLSLQFIENGIISDSKTLTFGIRQLEYKVVNNILFFYCNGIRLLIRGGNWGLPEAMLRCDSSGYDTRVKLHKEANFNMIRNWVGMTGQESFYDACDRYGILIWDDFWLANPVDGPDPKDSLMFMNNVRDKIKWVRKHPALALYCGRNEGMPPKWLDASMENETRLLDGTRHYIPHSASGTVTGLGPYDTREPRWYFENRGVTFHSELGIIAFPEVESMRRMMPAEDLWPINDMWALHDYQWGRSEKFTARIESRYGSPTGVEDYCRRAQLLNYESAKAMFECLQSNQGAGVLLWMSQAAWPSMICQLYDHYFEYTSAYFAAKEACRAEHILWDVSKNEIKIANNTISDLKNATAKATVYDASGLKLWEKSVSADVPSASAKSCFTMEYRANQKVAFLKLELTVNGKIIDDNFYWLENSAGNCLDLNNLPSAKISLNLFGESRGGVYSAKIKIKNITSCLSLLNKLKIKDKNSGESILPFYLSDDYVSLLPNEEKVITLTIDKRLLKDRSTELWLEGWNTKSIKIDFTSKL